MDQIFKTLKQVLAIPHLRKQILFTIFALLLFRILAHITIPGADMDKIKFVLENQGQSSSALSVFALLTGGAMENFSIVLMGLTPYINASIIIQLLAVLVPSLENLKKEGEHGQRKINQYTRLLSVPLAFVQSYGMMILLNRFSTTGSIIDTSSFVAMIPLMTTVTAGTMLLVWLGELISEKGIGNGSSLIIFAGIVSNVPTQIAGALQSASAPVTIGITLATILLTLFVIYVSEADRRVPVIYASRASKGQQKSFLPLKINQAGMIPIIFAVSVISFPGLIAQLVQNGKQAWMKPFSDYVLKYLNASSPTWQYNVLYTLLIVGFTYFYVSIVFEPKKIAENIQKRSGFIPGYRPGAETEKFLETTMSYLSFWGGLFLAFVAVIPIAFQRWITGGVGNISLFVSGAGLIIVVSVVLDLIRRINSSLQMHDYSKL